MTMLSYQFKPGSQAQESPQRQSIVLGQRDIEASLVEKMNSTNETDISSFFFVPTPLTPLYINPDDIEMDAQGMYRLKQGKYLPEGLIPDNKMNSIHTVLARVLTVHAMLKAGIPVTIFCPSEQRAKADGLPGFVDDSQLNRAKRKYPRLLDIRIISQWTYEHNADVMPAACYFNGKQFKAVYATQTNDQRSSNLSWGIDDQDDQFHLALKGLCNERGIDCPLFMAQKRTFDHSLYIFNYWEDRSLWKTLLTVTKQSLGFDKWNDRHKYNNMSAAAFYLGWYDEAERYADLAFQSSDYFGSHPKCRSLYLKSASLRARDRFGEAVQLCENALALYQEAKIDDSRLLAKIYFNLLAAEMDNPNTKLKITDMENLAEKTVDLLNKTHDMVEASRVSIRMCNYYLKLNKIIDAGYQLDDVSTEVKNGFSRVTGHYELAKGRLLVAKGHFNDATISFQRAMEIATELGAGKDFERAQHELNSLQRSLSSSSRCTV
jgi:hypothetical protein